MLGSLYTGQICKGGHEVPCGPWQIAGLVWLDVSWPAHDHGDADAGIVGPAFASRERSVVAPVEDNGAVGQAVFFVGSVVGLFTFESGPGRFRGGDGAVREIEFREPMSAAILSGHRRVPPFGLAGGGPGAVGHNRLIGADGSRTELGATAAFQVKGGDVLMVETPGGGGYGERTDKEETQRDEQ